MSSTATTVLRNNPGVQIATTERGEEGLPMKPQQSIKQLTQMFEQPTSKNTVTTSSSAMRNKSKVGKLGVSNDKDNSTTKSVDIEDLNKSTKEDVCSVEKENMLKKTAKPSEEATEGITPSSVPSNSNAMIRY